MTVIRSERLVLRPFAAADEAAVVAYRNDPVVARFQGWPLPFTAADFAALLDRTARPGDEGWVSRCLDAGAGAIGDIGLRRHGAQGEVGISLAASAQGRGYASEALAALCRHAFADLELHRLHAGIDPANAAVAALLVRAGWRDEGTARQAYWHRDRWADETTYALLADEWRVRTR